ncbi:putative tRNA isopentenyltransferase [Arabidopsis thaliana]|uniref:Adenylate isopentenyltransferase 4 n=1 Tax=Arabidopsis thaliana TaxID=3702 RepID=IPT4_ARATH|nr:isopentenyltransferase 4 [Arabidopsis thaliana]Q9SB60.1 RecName: Full=Adenylate isopentenyltransferase 4; Short=AtIPT4; AltName: Full=Adenylate dimethylallyltransferase 4; AltName: Full=Cytokinin synthase 4 [Arabidopsis thaliana]ABB83385.1 AtIPT4 [Quorum Sensing Vector p413-SSRE-AtIPT4]ABB83388.1 AtIPT4 [Quorum Sensing Vector p413-TR-SSRE-AtIPT4]ABB83391.1 AtIPT4 [Quorum Sensing Vector p413-PGAL1-AtIPT4]ABB83407.1 AtIPT4 [Sender Vector p416-GAL1-AtIPT4]AEE84938.1 isopentenyltransferase 4 [|eukprot:NP_194196.1 isopentenyltransferase 4 [Arabidopsis thaliana]
MKCNDKMVVIMGATGSGKSSLSVDLALHFKAEIINSDKMQFYDGLKITTNQSTIEDRRGVPHHLLGELNPEAGEVTAAEFRVMAAEAISEITQRKKLPILAGGSNSYIHALLAKSYDPENYPFSDHKGSICSELKYDCCFIWIDVDQSVLFEYLSLRLDLMMKSGMFEEIAEFHRSKKAPKEPLGIWKAIGVQEFDDYLKMYKWDNDMDKWDPMRKEAYEKAVRAIKENTFQLTKDQITKINKLRNAGWDIKKVDATASFREAIRAAKEGEGVAEMQRKIWNKEVLEPCVKIVRSHLDQPINYYYYYFYLLKRFLSLN